MLIECGIDVNTKNEAKSTPLHVACQPYNYDNEVRSDDPFMRHLYKQLNVCLCIFQIVHLLLKCGADIDQPNRAEKRPYDSIASNPTNTIPLLNYVSLQCLCATVLSKHKIRYKDQLHKQLEQFVHNHEP